jgi:hypothetical protein
MAQTLQSAVEGIPEAAWTSSDGTELTSQQVLSQWPAERLQQPVEFGEDQMGMTTIRAQANGETILTMLGPSGPDVLPPPVPRA